MASKSVCPLCNNKRNRYNAKWTGCDKCLQWFHDCCLGEDRVLDENDQFFCSNCQENPAIKSLETQQKEPVPSTSKNGEETEDPNNNPRKNLAKNIEYQKMVAAQKILLEKLKELGVEDTDSLLDDAAINAILNNGEHSPPNTAENGEKTPLNHRDSTHQQNQRTRYFTPGSGDSRANQERQPNEEFKCYKLLTEMMEKQIQLANRQYAELDVFDGRPDFWPTFYTNYLTTSKIGGFTDAQNLGRLRSHLSKDVRREIGGILYLPDQLPKVIERLEKHYGGKETIVRTQMGRLRSLRPADESDPISVRDLYECLDDIRSVLANIDALDYLTSPQTVETAEDKLMPKLRTHWIRYKLKQHGRRPDLNEFVEWLESYYDCAIEQLKYQASRRKERVHFQQQDNDGEFSGSRSNFNFCNWCRCKGHGLSTCRKFAGADLNSRWDCVRKNKLCFVCISGKHFTDHCSKKKACGVKSCARFHHPLLHREQSNPPPRNNPSEQEHTVSVHCKDNCSLIFRLIPVKLINGDREITTWAFCDEGSGPTLLSEEMADMLGLSGRPSTFCMRWTDGTSKSQHDSRIVSLEIAGIGKINKFRLENVRTVSNLNLPMAPNNLQDLKRKYNHLKDVYIPNVARSVPGILIGLEHAKLMIPYDIREGSWNQPIATKTRLGWSIHGKNQASDSQFDNLYSCHVCECSEIEEKIEKNVDWFFTTESFGVEVPDRLPESEEIIRAKKILNETTRNVGKRFETGLLWNSDSVQLPDNRKMAIRRLICFENKLKRDPDLMQLVKNKIQENIEKGHLEKVSQEQLSEMTGNRWYLPIFSVTNINKPNKVRIVYDAAAKFEGVSLNDVLLKGPDLNASLFGVLLRFRERAIGIVGDIEEMFHRVKIIEKDQQCQLVLWRDCDTNVPPSVLKLTVMSFGATSSPCSAQFVKNQNAKKFEKEYPRAVDSIINHHFVDDLLDSTDTPEEAIKLANQIKFIHSEGGFAIRNWMSNSKEVVAALNPTIDQGLEKNLNMSEGLAVERVLGLAWDTLTDKFLFKLSFKKVDSELISLKRVPTKREMLKIIMSIYDPLGMLATEVIHAKILMQQVWKYGTPWDEKIPDALVPMWNRWMERLTEVEKVRVPRCYSTELFRAKKIDLHVLADSSELAFATVAFLRIQKNDDQIELAFVASKTRVAPKKALSIPRLELQAAVLAVRLACSIKEEITCNIGDTIYWSDSQTVLGWIHSSHRRYNAFVSHRIGEILTHTTVNQWRWIQSKLNIADDATKWKDDSPILGRWFDGPEFLLKPEREWPMNKFEKLTTEEEVLEVHVQIVNPEIETKFSFVDVHRFSKWERLLRSFGFVIRFVNLIKNRQTSKNSRKKKPMSDLKQIFQNIPALTDDELKKAEKILIMKNQLESFPEEIHLLQQQKTVPKSSKIYQLSAFVEDDLLKMETRLDMAPPIISKEVKNPLIIGSSHRITYLIVEFLHRKFHHSARETIINEFRQKMWTTKIRPLINRVIRECNLCKFLRAKPRVPRMAALPPQRLAPFEAAFTYTGMDFFGPLEITVGRRHEKRYGVIFTCLTMRAVHLELAAAMDTNACVNCIRNFMNRRGEPREIHCDNGNNMKAAEKELKNAIMTVDFEKVASQSQNCIPNSEFTKFVNIPPGAPHFGGSWERMVGLIKRCLYKMLQEKFPKEDVLRCALIEAENMVNSRPLNYVTTLDDSPEAITPNHLLKINAKPVTCPDTNQIDWRKTWRAAQLLADEFWKRFVAEYVPTISKRSKWYDEKTPLKVGQLVLIVDENLKRGEWKRAIVTDVHPGNDGRIRSATVKTAKSSYLRPVSKLAVIDIEACKEFV